MTIKLISGRLCRASAACTAEIYTHAVPTLKAETANQIADLVVDQRAEDPDLRHRAFQDSSPHNGEEHGEHSD